MGKEIFDQSKLIIKTLLEFDSALFENEAVLAYEIFEKPKMIIPNIPGLYLSSANQEVQSLLQIELNMKWKSSVFPVANTFLKLLKLLYKKIMHCWRFNNEESCQFFNIQDSLFIIPKFEQKLRKIIDDPDVMEINNSSFIVQLCEAMPFLFRYPIRIELFKKLKSSSLISKERFRTDLVHLQIPDFMHERIGGSIKRIKTKVSRENILEK